MIKVSLHAPRPSYNNTLREARTIIKKAQSSAHEVYKTSRSRLARYLNTRRRQGFEKGYQEGLARAQADLAILSLSVRQHYGALLELARADAHHLAVEAAQEFVHQQIAVDASPLLPWIDRAIAIMKHSRAISISYHPRLAASLSNFGTILGNGITLTQAPVSQAHDFVVRGELGEVEFCLRDVLLARAADASTLMRRSE